MSNLKILDCTLRDGGYINNWEFGEKVIQGIISKLEESQIDIIECGFLRNVEYNSDVSVFSSVKQIEKFIPNKNAKTMYVAMIALGDIDINKLDACDGNSIDGIRLTFHKHEWQEAKKAVNKLMDKGYKVFVQPVGTTTYSDSELLALIEDVNEINPYALYLVDTLGVLYSKDLVHLFNIVEENLNSNVAIGFHSHNNLQLSFSNAQELINLAKNHTLILDSSIYGMGRGVGNLASELICEYINENIEYKYFIIPLLSIADKYVMSIYFEHKWGYDLPYFLSATIKCHPNYASYLMKKTTLKVEDINNILQTIPKQKRELFDVKLIEKLYYEYQHCLINDDETIKWVKEKLQGREVLLLAPGGSINENQTVINDYIKENNPFVIAVNHSPTLFKVDMIFISSNKRFDTVIEYVNNDINVVCTSNVQINGEYNNLQKINYSSYIGEGNALDNAGAMAIRFLKKCGVKNISMAGFDGFSEQPQTNFNIEMFRLAITSEEAKQKNKDITHQLSSALKGVKYKFITPTRYSIK